MMMNLSEEMTAQQIESIGGAGFIETEDIDQDLIDQGILKKMQ